MKNIISLFSSIALTAIPITAWGQNVNISTQDTSNLIVVEGSGNRVEQRNNVTNIQHNFGSTPKVLRSHQTSHHRAIISGNDNVIQQNTQQHNLQQHKFEPLILNRN